jgi:hypothetical protein
VNAPMNSRQFDRAAEDVGNIVLLEHFNVTQPDQRPTTLFYVVALGGTRDPYIMVGLENMWVNFGRTQVHMPSRDPQPQVVRGRIGFVVPDLAAVKARMQRVAPALKGTQFSWKEGDGFIDATCPWGNRVRVHPPGPEYGRTELGLVYIDFDVPSGTAEGIARFYTQVMGAPSQENGGRARVPIGRGQYLDFSETDARLPDYDGHHIEMYVAEFSGPYRWLKERELVTMETDAHEWRFQWIVDPQTLKPLFEIEHEVRSMRHPLFARPLVNRNPAITNTAYVAGHESFRGTY